MPSLLSLPSPRSAPRSGRGCRGASVPEITVTLALVSVISLIFFEMYVGMMRSGMFLESHNDLAVSSQQALNRIRREIIQSRIIFQDDAAGNGYLGALGLPGAAPLYDDSRLPVIDPNGAFEPDTAGDEKTGNILLMARQLRPLELPLDHDADASTAEIDFLTDVYRFEMFYLSPNSGRSFRPFTHYLDLVKVQSPVYADYFQLNGLPAAHRDALAQALFAEGIDRAWDPTQPVATAMYSIAADGTMTAVNSPSIAIEKTESLFPQFRGGAVTGNINYSVAMLHDPPLTLTVAVPRFGLANGQFPGGFEVQMAGPTGARKVMARLVTLAQFQNKINAVESTITAATTQF